MPFRRILKFINICIAALLILLLFALYWYGYRPLPKTSGTIAAPIGHPATVTRDALGVAHISAGSWEDALFLQGFVTAQDRMFQMDGLRRRAAGELSEVVGKDTVQLDESARRLRMRRLAEEHYRNLSPGDLALMAAYARGVNYYLETNRGHYALEFALLHYDPRPWSVVDTILASLEMFRSLTTTWQDEAQKQLFREVGNPAKVDFLFPVRTGREPSPGSNAWAIAGSHTASGRPILANDPHLEWSNPSTWYMIHLKAPGLNVSGATLPGLPSVIIGHNDRIAWGVTNLHYDVQDLYLEKINTQTGQYLYRGQPEQARRETDVIRVKGEKPIPFTTWITRHGPIFYSAGNRYYSLRWTAAEPNGFQYPFLDINRARNWQEFLAALTRFPGPGQNFVYADVDGNIGYHAAGRLPIRHNYNGDVPVDGSTGDNEWDGYIPFDQLPNVYNPPSGLIVTANQNPFPPDYPYPVNGNFASPYRSRQIRDLLSAKNGWKASDMVTVQKDVYSAFSRFLAGQLVKAFERRKPGDPAVAEAVGLLRSWDGQMDKESAAALVATLVFQNVREAVAESAAPKQGKNYELQMAPAVIERLLTERPAGWFPDYDDMLMKCFTDAIAEGTKMQGSNVKGWRYGPYNQLAIVQPVASHLPLIGGLFNIGPVWMSGSPTTVKQTTRRLGPSMRMAADLADWDHSFQNVTIGQSGHYLSGHYKDQWEAYYVGRTFPMQFNHVEGKSTLTVEPSTK